MLSQSNKKTIYYTRTVGYHPTNCKRINMKRICQNLQTFMVCEFQIMLESDL